MVVEMTVISIFEYLAAVWWSCLKVLGFKACLEFVCHQRFRKTKAIHQPFVNSNPQSLKSKQV